MRPGHPDWLKGMVMIYMTLYDISHETLLGQCAQHIPFHPTIILNPIQLYSHIVSVLVFQMVLLCVPAKVVMPAILWSSFRPQGFPVG